jgi:hypothetical protein
MHKQQIHIRGIQIPQRIIQRPLHILRVIIITPELCPQENLLTGHAALLDPAPDLLFDVVHARSVD